MNEQTMHSAAVTECQYDISTLDFENLTLTPSITISFNYSLNSLLKINFPVPTDSFTRFDQYQFISDYVSVINFCDLSLTSYMQFTCPEDLSVDSKLWGTDCFMALVGTISTSEFDLKEKEGVLAIVFNNVNGEFVSCEIDDANKWQNLVNNTEVFRDILYNALHSHSAKQVYRWDVIHKMLLHYNFTLDYSDNAGEDDFLISQKPIFV